MLIGLNSPSYLAHWDESLAPALLLMATWTRLGPANGTPLGRCEHQCVLSTEPTSIAPQDLEKVQLAFSQHQKVGWKEEVPIANDKDNRR